MSGEARTHRPPEAPRARARAIRQLDLSVEPVRACTRYVGLKSHNWRGRGIEYLSPGPGIWASSTPIFPRPQEASRCSARRRPRRLIRRKRMRRRRLQKRRRRPQRPLHPENGVISRGECRIISGKKTAAPKGRRFYIRYNEVETRSNLEAGKVTGPYQGPFDIVLKRHITAGIDARPCIDRDAIAATSGDFNI